MKRTIITVGRQPGSSGRETAQTLAKELGIPYYDREILTLAAEQGAISPELFLKSDEKKRATFLSSFIMNSPATYNPAMPVELPLDTRMALAQFEAIKLIASKEEHCVLLGRCADYYLRDDEDLVRIFITADYADRLKKIMKMYNLPDERAGKECLKKRDKERAAYYNFNTDLKWGMSANYDLCINTSRVGIDGAVSIIKSYLQSIGKLE